LDALRQMALLAWPIPPFVTGWLSWRRWHRLACEARAAPAAAVPLRPCRMDRRSSQFATNRKWKNR
jgi:hypothetical protein